MPNLVARFLETLGTRLGCVKQDTRDDITGVGDFHVTSSPPRWWRKTKISHLLLFVDRRLYMTSLQEFIKGSIYLPYLAYESTLSRVDLFTERLPWEIQRAQCCKSQSKQSYLIFKGNMIHFAGKTCSL